MNPILFPSTWLPRSAREVLLACFRRVTVLQPARGLVPHELHRLEKSGRLEILLPDEGSDELLPELLKAYHAWADLHGGERPDFHRFAQLAAPAPEDASTEWIRTRITGAEGAPSGARETPGGEAPAPLLSARLFLAVAQEYDQQSESLHRDLVDIAAMEKNLFQSLSPDAPPRTFIATGKSLPGGFGPEGSMTERRLASWRRLYANCLEKTADSTPLFVTDDPEALGLLLPPEAAPEMVCRVVGIGPAGEERPFVATAVHRDIDETLRSAAAGGPLSDPPVFSFSNRTPPAETTGTLTVYRITGSHGAPFSGGQAPPRGAFGTAGNGRKTPCPLLGHIERNCMLDSPK